jgi:hypothetical protein
MVEHQAEQRKASLKSAVADVDNLNRKEEWKLLKNKKNVYKIVHINYEKFNVSIYLKDNQVFKYTKI